MSNYLLRHYARLYCPERSAKEGAEVEEETEVVEGEEGANTARATLCAVLKS